VSLVCSSISVQNVGFFFRREGLAMLLLFSFFTSKMLAFFLRKRDSWYFWCAAASFSKIWAFFLGERDSQYCWIAAAFVSNCISKCFFICIAAHVLTTLATKFQLLPYFSHPVRNSMCLSCIHLSLFILDVGTLTSAACGNQWEAGSGQRTFYVNGRRWCAATSAE
jgi:hypothetical protein